MDTIASAITNIRRSRFTAIAMASAFAMALATQQAWAANPAPTAVATISPSAVWEGDTVTLNASGSHTNPPGGPLDYLWQQQVPSPQQLLIALSPDNKTVVVTFTAPAVPLPDLAQAVTFRVKVTDKSVGGGAKNEMSSPVTTTVYAPPGAHAEPKDTHISEGALVTLMGSATRAQPGATFTYTWTAPAGITLSDVHAQNPTFIAPPVGPAGQALTFTLIVTEHVAGPGPAHDKDSAPDSVTINIDNVNQPPTASASADPNTIVTMAEVDENSFVTLYGSGSDPDGSLISFHWTQVHDTSGAPLQPADTVVVLSDNTSPTPTFTAPDVTTAQQHIDLVLQLVTNDGQLNSGPSYVTIRVLNTNDPPVAVPSATPPSALEGDVVTLDGSSSSDPNGDVLTYTWEQTAGDQVTLAPSGSSATFVAPNVSPAQGSITLTFNLTVSDGELSDTKPVSVTVSHRNLPPVALAGETQRVPERSTAVLDGSNSYDPEGDTLTFAWFQLDGPSVDLMPDPNGKTVSFEAPTFGPSGGTLHFQLTVTDSHGATNSANVEVDVTYANRPPTANAGDDQVVNEVEMVSLAGSGADPDKNPLTFAWSQLSGPPGTIVPDPADPARATFMAPQVPCGGDEVVMELTADDGYGGVTTDDVTVDVANVNHPPTAQGGGNQQVSEGALVNLNGTGNDGDLEEVSSLTFEWTQISGDLVILGGSGKDVSFTAPDLPGGNPDLSVKREFRLTVTDVCGGSATADVTVDEANIPHAPVAVATGPTEANEKGNITLDGNGSSDPDGDWLWYTWTQSEGPAVTLYYGATDTRHVMPMFLAPWVSADTPLKFKLTVNDQWDSSSAYVTVMIRNSHTPPNVANARADVPALWPPDHKMAPVQVLGVVKPSGDKITITGVTQDEPTNGLGDGDTPVDAIIHHNDGDKDDTVDLRAERSGKGDGRVYRIQFFVDDPEQSASGSINVAVPKSKKTDVSIDSSGNYDSTH